MTDCTFTTTLDDTDAYAIEMDATCISMDYDVADDLQYQLEEIAKEDCDILFE